MILIYYVDAISLGSVVLSSRPWVSRSGKTAKEAKMKPAAAIAMKPSSPTLAQRTRDSKCESVMKSSSIFLEMQNMTFANKFASFDTEQQP